MQKGRISSLFCSILVFLNLGILHDSQAQDRHSRIAGTVKDANTGAGLPYVNIVVVGTVLGTISDLQGNFLVENVPAGACDLRFTLMGYESQTARDVRVAENETATVRISLVQTAIASPDVVVTASKRAQSIQDSPNSISVLTARDFEQKNQVNLDDMLEYAPGVNFMGDQINIRGSSGFSYGVGSRVLFLLDGIPVMSGDTGEIEWDLIPVTQIDRIEIVKSAGSALYGSSALGGMINVITKDAALEPKTNLRFNSGIYNDPPYPEWKWSDKTLYFSDVDITHSRQTGKTGLYVSAGRHQSTGYRQNGEYLRYNGTAKANFKLSSEQNLTLSAFGETGESEIGLMWRDRYRALEVDPQAVGDKVKQYKYNLNALHKWAANQKLALNTRLSYFRDHFRDYMHDNKDWSTAQTFGSEIQANYFLSKVHTLTLGSVASLDKINSDPLGHHNIFNGSAYAQDELQLQKNVLITLGARYDYTTTDTDITDNQMSPKLGIVWHLNNYSTVRLSSGKGFRAPTISERFPNISAAGLKVIPNPELTPETAWSHEIGLSTPVSSFLLLDIAAFRNDYWYLIEPVPDESNTVQFINLTRARISGLETMIGFAFLNRRITGQFGYTFLDPIDLEAHETLAYRSKNMFKGSLSGSYRNVELGVDYIYYGRLEVVKVYPSDPRVAQQTFDAHFTVDYGVWKISLNGNNLFNHMHTQVERTIMPIRHFTATLRLML